MPAPLPDDILLSEVEALRPILRPWDLGLLDSCAKRVKDGTPLSDRQRGSLAVISVRAEFSPKARVSKAHSRRVW